MKTGFFGLEELNFVEFNISGDEANYQKLSETSRFISAEIFNLFVHCFENSMEMYEYFEPTKFNSRRIIVLRNELIKNIELLINITTVELFNSYFEKAFWGANFIDEMNKINNNWIEKWKTHLDELIAVNKEIIEIIDKCLENEQVLWVIGY